MSALCSCIALKTPHESVKLILGTGISYTVDHIAGYLLKVHISAFDLACKHHLTGGDKSFASNL